MMNDFLDDRWAIKIIGTARKYADLLVCSFDIRGAAYSWSRSRQNGGSTAAMIPEATTADGSNAYSFQDCEYRPTGIG